MPEQTETLTQKPEEVVVEDKGPDSGTESESDDSIPELEDTGAGGAGEGIGAKDPVAAAAGLNEELVSKAKQSRGEKKARKIMSKLGLRQVRTSIYFFRRYIWLISSSIYRIRYWLKLCVLENFRLLVWPESPLESRKTFCL